MKKLLHVSAAMGLSKSDSVSAFAERKDRKNEWQGGVFCKKLPLFLKQSTGLFEKFTPEKSDGIRRFRSLR